MLAQGGRLPFLTASLAGLAAMLFGWLHLFGPNGGLSEGAATLETLALAVPVLVACIAAAAIAWNHRRMQMRLGGVLVAASWTPWGALHLWSRGLDHAGAWAGVLQVALALGLVGAVFLWAASKPRVPTLSDPAVES